MKQKEYLLVDGYNVIFAWDELKAIAETNLGDARDRLVHMLSNYKGYRDVEVIVVFDAHKTKEPQKDSFSSGVHVIFTDFAQTADEYIERAALSLKGKNRVSVATSDRLEQVIILGYGALRLSAREFIKLIKQTEQSIEHTLNAGKPIKTNMLIDNLDPKTAKFFEDMRRL